MCTWYDEIKTQPEPVVLLIFGLGRKCHWGEQRESHCGAIMKSLDMAISESISGLSKITDGLVM